MRKLLLLLPLVGLLASCKSPMEIVNESLLNDSFKVTGGENPMLSSGGENSMLSYLSTMDAEIASGEKELACSTTIIFLETTAIVYDDTSKESMDDLREYQRLCGRRVFR